MRSIRLSLIVYFLLLLALTLGVASALAYQTTHQTLLAKKEATRKLIEAQHDKRCEQERAKFDAALLFQARTLNRLAQFDRERVRHLGLPSLGLMTAFSVPNGHLLLHVWLAEAAPYNRLSYELSRRSPVGIRFDEDDLLHLVDPQVAEYFQVNSLLADTYLSPSLSLAGWSFPVDPNVFAPDQLPLNWEFDDVDLEPGLKVRRVKLKAPAARLVPFRPPGSRGPLPPGPLSNPPSDPRPRPDRNELPLRPVVFIQCACKTDSLDTALAEFAAQRDGELGQLESDSAASLARLRNRLLTVGLIAFAGSVVGGFWLVRHGLQPLGQLSEAVRRVSARDFRLQFDEPHLPRELRPIVERINQTLDLLKRAFAREKQAAADISHELRTPLAALLTTIEVALRKTRSPEEYRELLEDCRASGQQMNQLVEHLLTLARLDAGMDLFRPRAVDVAVLARQCVNLVRPLAEARGLTLQVKCHEPASLTTDPDKLRELVTNLLHNAIEYNRPQGFVELEVGRQNGHLRLEVRDSGIGIPREAREHIFERFYRADPSRQADGLHAGLGLSIVKGYVDLMGGTIAVESEPGEGSTFRVELPAGEDDKVTR